MGQIAGAAITAGANTAISAATNATNAAIASNTNDTNKRIAEGYNETQVQLWHEQQQHDLDMWNLNNQYNSPKAQQERLIAAGINPVMLDAGTGNVSSSSAGGQTPPSLSVPQMQPYALQSPQFDMTQLGAFARAYKDVQEGRKAKSEATLSGLEESAYADSALRGENPFVYKAKMFLEEYMKLKKENKWINPLAEKNLAKLASEIDMNKMFIKVRKQELKKVEAETKGLNISNKYSEKLFKSEIAKFQAEVQKINTENSLAPSIAAAQINAANAGANLSNQSVLTEEQNTDIARSKAIQESLRATLARCGINPDDKTLPYVTSLAAAVADGRLTVDDVARYFSLIQKFSKEGVERLADSATDLAPLKAVKNALRKIGVVSVEEIQN